METPSIISAYAECRRILRVYTRNGDEAVFEIYVGQAPRGRLLTSTESLHLPRSGSETLNPWPGCGALPTYLVNSLASGLAASDDSSDPVWLLLDRPAGFLPMLHWERLLGPALRAPLLRLPHRSLRPFAARRSLDVAVCFGCPDESEDNLTGAIAILEAIPHDAAPVVRVYVFARARVADRLEQVRSQFKFAALNIHTPSDNVTTAVDAAERSNPWLVWMRKTLDTTAVDCVQFINHCVQVEEQGKLVFAPLSQLEHATGWRSNAREIATFLEQAGAWSAAFISPPSNASDAGMRMLQDQVAWLRPGPLYLVNVQSAADFRDLAGANRFVLGPDLTNVPSSPQVSIQCHPSALQSPLAIAITTFFAKVPGTKWLTEKLGADVVAHALEKALANETAATLLGDPTLVRRLGSVFTARSVTPAQAAGAKRALERALAQLNDPLETQSIRTSATKALTDAAQWVARNAREPSTVVEKLGGLFNRVTTWRGR